MFDKRQKFSYAEQRTENLKKLKILFWISLFFVAHLALSSLFITTRALQNKSMLPGLLPGDRFVILSFGLAELFPEFPLFRPLPLKRGDIVLVTMKDGKKPGVLTFLLDRLCRFATLGRYSITGKDERRFLKRLIALPGDEVSMTNYVMRVKQRNDVYTYTEFELSKELYTTNIPEVSALWDSSLPFSGNMPPIMVGKDAYFLLSDDRANTNDSRTWGAIPAHAITGKALFRYWPLLRFGKI